MEEGICQICGAKAVVQLRSSWNEMERSVFLCETCARNYGIFSLIKTVPMILRPSLSPAFFEQSTAVKKLNSVCGHCGWTVEQLRESRSVGCYYCYEDLREAILNLKQEMGVKSLEFKGKFPRHFIKNPQK